MIAKEIKQNAIKQLGRLCLSAAAILCLLTGSAQAAENDISAKNYMEGRGGIVPVNDPTRTLLGYPIVGAYKNTAYYLDTESCVFTIEDGRATLLCIVYGAGSGGVNYSLSHEFSTYKKDGQRKIFLQNVTAETGHDITQNRYEHDNGFAKNLFWQAAKACGLAIDLD